MEFTSTIPISPVEAALLSAASARNCLRALSSGVVGKRPDRDHAALADCVHAREAAAAKHLARAVEKEEACSPHCTELREAGERLREALAASAPEKPPQAALRQVEEIVTQLTHLRPDCAYCR
jgi:hypothetical protein